jgi:hypothetical protein
MGVQNNAAVKVFRQCPFVLLIRVAIYVMHNNSDRTSKRTHWCSASDTDLLMLFRQISSDYSDNRMKHRADQQWVGGI